MRNNILNDPENDLENIEENDEENDEYNLHWASSNLPSTPYVNSFYQSIYNTILNNTTTDNTNLTNTETFINNSLYTNAKYKKVLSTEGEYDLEKIQYKSDNNYNNTCPIYQINFEENEEVIKLPCNHCFTQDAILKWLKEEQAVCPVCRYELKSIEIKDQESESESEIDEETSDIQNENNANTNTSINPNTSINSNTSINPSTNEITPLLNQFSSNILNLYNTNPSYQQSPFTNIDTSNLQTLIESVVRTNPTIPYPRRLRPRHYTSIATSYIDQEEEELQQALMESLLPEYATPQTPTTPPISNPT